MDAPLLFKIEKEQLEQVRYDPLKIAEIEFKEGVLPITVKRPFPKNVDVGLRRDVERKENVEKTERKEEADIKESGEIMELAQPDDEMEDIGGEEEAGEE